MTETYVFDFYNLYIPINTKYENKELGIKIKPLKVAEEFNKNRKKYSSKYHYDNWKTAKCFIRSDTGVNAKKIASWLEFLYSFTQDRSIFFLSWYKYKTGKKYSSRTSKKIEYRDNGSIELISHIYTEKGYTKNISWFIDKLLKKLNESNEETLNIMLTTIHAYIISNSQITLELKFLILWIALEKLANNHYDKIKSKPKIFDKKKRNEIKEKICKCLEISLKNEPELLFMMKKNMEKNYLYEFNTVKKLEVYFEFLEIGFNNKKLKAKIIILSEIRNDLTHNLTSQKLINNLGVLSDLQVILQNVIFRILEIDKNEQKKLGMAEWFARTELERE